MFNIGDVLIYTTYGICKIVDITEMKLGPNIKKNYVLVPLTEEKTKFTLPVDNPMTKLRLHELLSKDEINTLLHEIPFIETFWIDRDNDRKMEFGNIVKSGNRKNTLQVMKSIKVHTIEVKDKGRKLHSTDEQAYKDAEKLILDEFSYVLEMDRASVLLMLNTELDK